MAHRRAVFLDAVESQLGRGEVLGCFYRDEDSLWHSLSLDSGCCSHGQSAVAQTISKKEIAISSLTGDAIWQSK